MSGPAPVELFGLEIQLGTHTDPGRVRSDNEDRLLVFDLRERKPIPGDTTVTANARSTSILMMVADGKGGMSGGETASQMCVDSIPELFGKHLLTAAGTWREQLRSAMLAAIRDTNKRIFEHAKTDANRPEWDAR